MATVLLTLAFAVAPVRGQGIPQNPYNIGCEEMRECFGANNDTAVAFVNVSPIIRLNHAIVIMGSEIDAPETDGFEQYVTKYPVDSRFIIGDNASSIYGVNTNEFDLVLVGGPDHNAYTRKYLDMGVLTYGVTNITGPGLVMEAATVPSGHTIVVIGSAESYPQAVYPQTAQPHDNKESLWTEAAPMAAVVAGAGLGILGPYLIVFFSRTFEFIYGFISTYAGEVASEKEAEIRKVHAVNARKVVFMGYTWRELIMAISCLFLFGIAFVIADGMDIEPGNILFYIVVGGFVVVAHELGHRLVAYRLSVNAEFKFWGLGSITMLLTSWLFGLVFAQPGRVVIEKEEHNPEEMAAVMLAGPATSLGLSIIFLLMMMFDGPAGTIGLLGFSMNMVTVVYSLMPFNPMDGKTIFDWNRAYWAVLFVPISILFVVATYIVV